MEFSAKTPVLVALVSALLWGLWWIPIHALDRVGFTGLWAGVAMSAGALPVLIIAKFWRKPSLAPSFKSALGASFAGGAMILYSAALSDTTVLRAVLLFYLAPAWSIAIECIFMGRKLRWINILGLALALLGVVFIFRGNISFEDWRLGDTVAILSGMFWATGAALIYTAPPAGLRNLSLVACISATTIGLAAALGFGVPATQLDLQADALLPALVSGCFYLAPVLLATLWSARFLKPATLSFLLTAEIISGVVSAAIFLSEPFGAPEILGALLIIAAGLTEVSPRNTQS